MSKKGKKKPSSDSNFEIVPAPSALILPDYSILQSELRNMLSYADLSKSLLHETVMAHQRMIEASTQPFRDLMESIRSVASFQREIAEQALTMQKLVRESIINSGLLEITNSFKNFQIEAFAGLTIKSELLETLKTINNGVVEVSTIKESKFLAGGRVNLGIEKTTSSEVSAEIVYTKIETIGTSIQMLDSNLSSTNIKVEKLEKMVTEQNNLLYLLQNNPFPYFRINKIEFLKSSSQFVINGMIPIRIQSKTLHDYICQILFSGSKRNLTDEWDLDEIKEHLKILMGYAEAEEITWKKVQEAVYKINLKIASKTTKENLICSPRSETIQLNPEYFISSN